MMFKKILVPLDGSELAEWALSPALKLAAAAQAELILLRSTIPLYMAMPVVAGEYEWAWPEYAREQMRTESREYLQGVQERYELPGLCLHTMDVEGDAASMIVDTAVDEGVDLIVMSTHGRSGFNKWILGSVTERVLHSAPCPVLAIRSDQPITRLLIALDGSQLAEKAIEPALALADTLKARVTLLRVNEPLLADHKPSVQFEWEVGRESIHTLEQNRRNNAENYLCEVVRRAGHNGLNRQWMVVNGQPVPKILEFAQLQSTDLIAMSTHGRSGLRRWLLGSVTAKVMHSFPGHMLIVRPPNKENSPHQ
jgi:nucleotide-binding universal stress UspA family protein